MGGGGKGKKKSIIVKKTGEDQIFVQEHVVAMENFFLVKNSS